VIDLHLHTTASDGRCSPAQLARRASEVALRVIAVTDHDTMAAVDETTHEAAARGITVIPGIEVTSVLDGRDVHVLGYYVDGASARLRALLAAQRSERAERAREIASRLAAAGAPVDVDALLADSASRGGSVARPQLAAALVANGHATSVSDAFDRLLGEGCCGYVPHRGPTPAEVVDVIAGEGALASLAHPGTNRRDDIIPGLVSRGLGAIEAYHSAHDVAQQTHYLDVARRFDLAVSGGSDYHGEGVRRAEFLGVVGLPAHEFERLQQRARAARV
jgi:predicted metal-dependent phosphoesterase TrpH